MGATNPDELLGESRLLGLSYAYQYSQVVYVAAKLGIADLLRGGPKSVKELVRETGVQTVLPMKFLLQTLAHLDVLDRRDDGRYALRPQGELLLSDHPQQLGNMIITNCETRYAAWGRLLDTVRTGTPAFHTEMGQGIWDHFAEQPERADQFYRSMWDTVRVRSEVIVEAFDFSQAKHVVDIGAGYGALGVALLRAIPHIRMTIFDLPHTVEPATALVHDAGLRGRCEIKGGSFFDEVPPGADVYILNRVLTDWDDEQAVKILERCRAAMTPSAVLLIVTSLLSAADDDSVNMATKGLNLLVLNGGRPRTWTQLDALVRRAGLRTRQILRSGEPSVVEATIAEAS